jgi:nucleoside-diphosphate-sugar epimerase
MGTKVLVLGAGGFIGSHMVSRLKIEGCFVVGADLKFPDFSKSKADQFFIGDLRNPEFVEELIQSHKFDYVYQFAADMGGAGYVFTGLNDANVLHNSSMINLNILNAVSNQSVKPKIFYSSSACIYPDYNQNDPNNPNCKEDSAYPANPDSEYGWEKLFSERLYQAYSRNFDIPIAIARYHNIYGPEGTWQGGKEKAPAAICRKVAETLDGEIEIWGDGKQTRSFLYITDCIEATYRLMNSNYSFPVNIGSEQMVTINELAKIAGKVSGKEFKIRYELNAPVGVRGRNSDNNLIRSVLNWDYLITLEEGIAKTYSWILDQVKLNKIN